MTKLTLRISKKAIAVKRTQSTAALTILFFIFGGLAVFFPVAAVILSLISLIIYIYVILIFLKRWYNSYSYELSGDCIRIEKGVFVTKSICVFKSKVQYSAVIQTPLQRIFRTCTIIYHTAGAVVYLSEIDIEGVSLAA